MPDTQWLPPANKDFNAAKRQYVEQFGSALVTNMYLRIAVLALCFVVVALVALHVKTNEAFRNVKPLVIRINDVGRAEAVPYESFGYQPKEAEIKYFLNNFVECHYSRMRATAKENYARSLYFLDGPLADTAIESDKKTHDIETFLAGQGEEIEVHVNNVSIEDLRNPPYKATVDFEKTYYAPGSNDVSRHEKYTVHVVFIVKDRVPNSLIPINPLGLTITYFREDQAFK